MPYSVNDKNLPANVKRMPDKRRRAWVKIWNSSYSRCTIRKSKASKKPSTDAQKKSCEGEAFRIANAMTRKLEILIEGGTMDGLFYIDLALLKLGKIFDAVVPGTFVDMLGRKVTFKKSDLQKYVKNTQEAIEAATTESGEVVGLPIDARGHDKGDGAGWIVAAALEDGKVRLTPKWTEIGQELIQKGIRRFFSPTVDTASKVILGGTLTNWPATRDKKGKIMLRPIELEDESFMVIDEEKSDFGDLGDADPGDLEDSLNQKQMDISRAFRKQFGSKKEVEYDFDPYIVDTFEDYAIIYDSKNRKHFSAPFVKNKEGMIEFSKRSEWKEVKKSWVEAALAQIEATGNFLRRLFAGDPETDSNLEVIEMEMTQEELTKLISEQVGVAVKDLPSQVIAEMTAAAAGDPETDDSDSDDGEQSTGILALLGLEGLSEDVKDEIKKAMSEVYDQQKDLAAKESIQMIAGIRKESHVSDFSVRVTGGTEAVPRGFVTDPGELKKFILAQTPDDAKYIQNLLEAVLEGSGIVEFEELGNSKKTKGTVPLPVFVADKLDAKEIKVEDLAEPMLGLGDVSQYDLSKWQE